MIRQIKNALVSAFVPGGSGTDLYTQTNSVFTGVSSYLTGGGSSGTTTPFAFLNYIVFDTNFNRVASGHQRVSSVLNAKHLLTLNNINITQKGYVYIWVSNESNQNHNTYFDDLKVTHTKGPVLQEDHYYPFGATINALSSSAPLSKPNQFKYNGKEFDNSFNLGLYDYGARFYDPLLGRWNAIDEMADKNSRLSPYHYVYNNPINAVDPDGKDGILIVFPDYMVDTETIAGKMRLGHAGVLLIDNKTGLTKYYEYGRYPTKDGTKGRVRNVRVSDVVIGDDGRPTQESLTKVLKEISEKSGKGGRIEGAYTYGDFKTMNDFASALLKQSNPEYKEYDKDRKPYKLLNNNCATFACDVLKQIGLTQQEAPWILDPRPSNYASEYQNEFDSVSYDPETGITTYTVNEKYYGKYLEMLKQQQAEKEKKDENNE